MSEAKIGATIRLIERVVERELSSREDALHRALIEHKRGLLTLPQLRDYQADAELGREALRMWHKLKAQEASHD